MYITTSQLFRLDFWTLCQVQFQFILKFNMDIHIIYESKMIILWVVYNSYLPKYSDFVHLYFAHSVYKSSGSTTHGPYQKSRTYTLVPFDIVSDTVLHRALGCVGRTCRECCSCSRLFHHHNIDLTQKSPTIDPKLK